MDQIDNIRQAMTDFIKGGDERNLSLLEKVLHKDFRVASNGYMGTPGVTLIDKAGYLSRIQDKTFGGLPRTMHVKQIDQYDTIAMVAIELESAENTFCSYNSFVLDEQEGWKLIHNLAIVKTK